MNGAKVQGVEEIRLGHDYERRIMIFDRLTLYGAAMVEGPIGKRTGTMLKVAIWARETDTQIYSSRRNRKKPTRIGSIDI